MTLSDKSVAVMLIVFVYLTCKFDYVQDALSLQIPMHIKPSVKHRVKPIRQ